MALNVFAGGSFSTFTNCAEWDGFNEGEILDWVRSSDPLDPGLDEANRWQIASTSPSLVLRRPATHPAGRTAQAIIPLNGWVSGSVPSGVTQLIVQPVDPAGKWKTADPYGRPTDLNDVLPPAPA